MFKENNDLYKELDVLLTNIHHLDIPLDKNWKKIAVNLSGGADSALLSYFLCKIITDNNLKITLDVITYKRCWTTRPWQGHISMQVYNKLKSLFPNVIGNRHTTFIPPELEHGVIGNIVNDRSGDQIIVSSFNSYIAWEEKFDAVYNATSKNYDDSRKDRMLNRDKDAQEGNLTDLWNKNKSLNCVFVHPFRFVKKDWIVAQYHLHGILDLYNLTRSCEGDINHHENVRNACGHFKDYRAGMEIPVCNECWWCQERAWADSRVFQIIREINEF